VTFSHSRWTNSSRSHQSDRRVGVELGLEARPAQPATRKDAAKNPQAAAGRFLLSKLVIRMMPLAEGIAGTNGRV
jgi:hypothetical protein